GVWSSGLRSRVSRSVRARTSRNRSSSEVTSGRAEVVVIVSSMRRGLTNPAGHREWSFGRFRRYRSVGTPATSSRGYPPRAVLHAPGRDPRHRIGHLPDVRAYLSGGAWGRTSREGAPR